LDRKNKKMLAFPEISGLKICFFRILAEHTCYPYCNGGILIRREKMSGNV
jgi:hypothetical protein